MDLIHVRNSTSGGSDLGNGGGAVHGIFPGFKVADLVDEGVDLDAELLPVSKSVDDGIETWVSRPCERVRCAGSL